MTDTAATTGQVLAEEKCERCGWDLALIDLLAAAKVAAGMDPAEGNAGPGPEWCEIHQLDDGTTLRLSLQQHTPERCQRRRDGNPEPFEWSDTTNDEDDWDEEW